MNSEAHQKVQAEHLVRNAFLYVRQSTLRQVRENVESSQRQYGLARSGPRAWVDDSSRLWSSTATKANPEAALSSGKDFRGSSPRSA